MKAYERLMRYARVHTSSRDGGDTVPSTACQFDLARLLAEEMTALGVSDVYLDEKNCYVYGKIPATPGLEDKPCIGFLAHLDTIPDEDFSGVNVAPRLVENYDGGDIPLGSSGRVLSPKAFPHLAGLKGCSLVVTDGTTVLGADDKAGVAEIMTAAEELLRGELPHGPVAIGFCPDEEIGHGAAALDLDRFGAKLAYTLDGAGVGEIEYENFNAAAAEVTFRGFNVHPGSAKNTMINASLVAMAFNAMLPAGDTPRDTEGYEGFFHLTDMTGNVESATLHYIIRDHDSNAFELRKKAMLHAAALLNDRYGAGTVTVTMHEQYRNMIEKIKPHFEVVEKAMEATRQWAWSPSPAPSGAAPTAPSCPSAACPAPTCPPAASAITAPTSTPWWSRWTSAWR